MCNLEKHMKDFYKKYAECEDCISKRGLNFTMPLNIKYQTNERFIIKRRDKKKIKQE